MGVIARQSIKGALANYAGVAIGFVTTFFVLTRCLTTEEVGLTRVMVDAAVLFSSLALLGTNSSVVRFFPYFSDGGRNRGVFGLSLLLPLVGFGLFGLLFLLFRDGIVGLYEGRSPLLAEYVGLLPMLVFCAMYLTVFETNASVLLRITVPKLVREVGIRLLTLASYVLYGLGWVSFDGFVWLFCGSYGVAMLLSAFYLLRITGFDLGVFKVDFHAIDRRLWGEMLRYSLLMTAVVIAGNVPLLSTLFLGAKTGLAATGVYAIALYIANVVEVPYRSLGAVSRPILAASAKSGRWGEVNRLGRQVSLHQMLVSLTIFFLIWINLDLLFSLLPNGEAYAGGAGVVFVLGLAKVVNSSFAVGADVLNYSRFYVWSLLFALVLTGAALVCNQWLIGVWGINGAAVATLLSYVAYFLLLLWFVWRRLRVHFFSVGQVKVVAVVAVGLLLGEAWEWGVGKLVGGEYGVGMRIVLAAVKTVVLGGGLLWAVVKWRVSDEVNELIGKTLRLNKANKG
ncbi:MAG: lipopolysaccharide biosynthesis protein [Bacteroidales bacterium]|nr:lipopolysaccharide biosynthesis protein [Bacteroidales bacterium]